MAYMLTRLRSGYYDGMTKPKRTKEFHVTDKWGGTIIFDTYSDAVQYMKNHPANIELVGFKLYVVDMQEKTTIREELPNG